MKSLIISGLAPGIFFALLSPDRMKAVDSTRQNMTKKMFGTLSFAALTSAILIRLFSQLAFGG
jgi:hypothetical protein